MIDYLSLNFYGLPFILSGLIILYLGLFNLTKFKAHVFSIPFAFLCIAQGIWLLGTAPFFLLPFIPKTTIWFRLYYIGVCFIPCFFYMFTISFLKLHEPLHRRTQIASILFSALFTLLALIENSTFISGSTKYYYGYYHQYGVAGILFMLYFAVIFGFSFRLWFQAHRTERYKTLQNRIAIISIGFIFATLASINFIPCFNIPLYPFGFIFVLISMSFLSYAIYIHQPSDIRSWLQHMAFRFFILVIAFVIWSLLSFPFILFFKRHMSFAYYMIYFPVYFSTLLVFAYYFVPFLEQIIYTNRINLINSMQTMIDQVVSLKDPTKFSKYITLLIKRFMRTDHVKIVFKSNDTNHFYIVDDNNKHTVLPEAVDDFLPWLKKHPGIYTTTSFEFNYELQPIRELANKAFNDLDIQIIISLNQDDVLYGFIGIGRRHEQQLYGLSESSFLKRLKPMATIALINSFYYDHLKQLGRNLWNANDYLNHKIAERTEELEHALESMIMLNDEQNNFFTMALHNLRTPLTSITASSTILWRSHPIKGQSSLYSILQNSIKRLNALSLDIVEIAKLEARLSDLNYLKFDIRPLVQSIAKQLIHDFENKTINWFFDCQPQIQFLHAEQDQIKLALTNLLSNAFKFCRNEGNVILKVTITTREDLLKYNLHTIEHPNTFYQFAVSDQGPSIPENEQQFLFESFSQGLSGQKYAYSSGLGLYIVKRIIENHGGAVAFDTSPETGTTFFFILPA